MNICLNANGVSYKTGCVCICRRGEEKPVAGHPGVYAGGAHLHSDPHVGGVPVVPDGQECSPSAARPARLPSHHHL